MALVDVYEPINILKPVAPNIWIVDGPIEHMQQFGLNVPFPTRMTVIKLSDDRLFLHSPTKPDEELRKVLDQLGVVSHLVSPNKIHYASIHVWHELYPDAKCWASPGVVERAASRGIKVHFDEDLGDRAPDAWGRDIDQHIFRGSKFMDEVIFFHKSSKTLILTDLIENFEPTKVSRVLRWMLKLAGNLDPDGKLPIDLRMTFKGSHDLACKSYDHMLRWAPERVILAHGRWYDKNGSLELKRAFRWLSCGDKKTAV